MGFAKAVLEAHSTKIFCLPSGEPVRCQGYEPECFADLLGSDGVEESDIVVGWPSKLPAIWYDNPDTGKRSRYFPDGYIVSTKTVIEVKSPWTYQRELAKNLAKFDAVVAMGMELHLHIYDRVKGKGVVRVRRMVLTA